MEKAVRIIHMKHELSTHDRSFPSTMEPDDVCFFRFIGGSPSETEALLEQLYLLKETKGLLIGIFRFPFRFEGKKRLQTAIKQYHQMRIMCDSILYFDSDGMMETLEPGTSIQEANQIFEAIEEAPVHALEEMLNVTGVMNIDFRDLQAFIRYHKGPIFIRTFEGESFDEPLKYLISAPFLAKDYADGEQLILNIGYTSEVDMDAFRQINLRLNDLFHKADLFKIGTYFIDEPGYWFRITLLVNGIKDPYPRPDEIKRLPLPKQIWKKKWNSLIQKSKELKWFIQN